MKTFTDLALHRIRSYIHDNDMSINGFAKLAGMAEGTVRHVLDDEFNPRAKTLRKMEKAVPVKYKPANTGDPAG